MTLAPSTTMRTPTSLLPMFCAAALPRHHLNFPASVLVFSLLATVFGQAWSTPHDVGSTSGNNVVLQEDYSEAIRVIDLPSPSTAFTPLAQEYPDEVQRTIEAYPDVVVFPIHVAGSVVASATTRNLANKIADAGNIAVIYPDIGEPYRSVFTQIIGGIEDKAKGRVANFAVGPNVNVGELNDSLRKQDTKVVIALGRQGMKVASALNSNMSVVVGGVLTAQENETRNQQVNSLSPDPALLFSRLKEMMPKVRRIFAVYDSRQNGWMMRLAKDAARVQGLELVTYEVQDLRNAMHAYQEILAATDSNQDALWLPQDSTTVEESSVLPLVLQESWAHNLTVFSSSFGHVRRGVLFSLYPNNVELGHHLADSALGLISSGENNSSGMRPLREVLMAVNLRTAKHLGINASKQQGYAMTFPEQ